MPDAFYHLPLFVVGLVVVSGFCLYSMVGAMLARRFLHPRLGIGEEDSEFTGSMMQAVMVFYGLAMALIAVSVWETHSEISNVVSSESSRLACLYRDVGGYPEPVRSELRAELVGYADYLIDEAWPQHQAGVHPQRGVEWMNRFQASLYTFEPASEGMKILHAETLRAYNHMLEARRLRLDAMLVKLPGTLWFVICFGGVVSLASTFLFKVRSSRLHLVQVILLSVFIGMITTLIFAFDRPFHGELGIDSESYRLVRSQLMTP